MDRKLKAWLDSLSPEERSKAVEKLGPIAIETPEEKFANVIRKAAGLPEVDTTEKTSEDPTENAAKAARKAAGLE